MRNLLAVASAVAVLSASGLAAENFDFSVANFAILQDKRVQKEVGITAAQRDQLNRFAAADNERRKAIIAAAQKAKEKELTPDQKKAVNASLLKLRSEVLSSLKPEQLRRLRELTIQSAGPIALLEENIARRLKVTLDQRKKIAAAYQAGQKEAVSLRNAALGPLSAKWRGKKPKNEAEAKTLSAEFNKEMRAAEQKVAPRLNAISMETGRKIMAIVTAQQRAEFEALKGKPFRP